MSLPEQLSLLSSICFSIHSLPISAVLLYVFEAPAIDAIDGDSQERQERQERRETHLQVSSHNAHNYENRKRKLLKV